MEVIRVDMEHIRVDEVTLRVIGEGRKIYE